MLPSVNNLFADLPTGMSGESIAGLFDDPRAKIERIVSHSHASPEGFWYDQEDDEWVILLSGSATLEFFEGGLVELLPGDYLTIPAHVKHRVARTSPQAIWLAVHCR